MIQDAIAAFRQVFSPAFRRVLFKSLGLTIAILVLAWFGLERLLRYFIAIENAWIATTVAVLAGLSLVVAMIFLVAPISALVAGFYLDELAEQVETSSAPIWPAGNPLPTGQAIGLAARFALLALAVNLGALLLLLVPGVNAIAFIAANSYLMGREFFALAAMRYRPIQEAQALRRAHAPYLFLAGFPIALFLSVPLLNLLTPLFAVAYMARIHKRMSGFSPPLRTDGEIAR
ncbi:MAG: sulfate transporter family protein [Beijerinckiaceae bacterium]|nr:sulfate transporter family protein [Beijerinckiaceae bacterium]